MIALPIVEKPARVRGYFLTEGMGCATLRPSAIYPGDGSLREMNSAPRDGSAYRSTGRKRQADPEIRARRRIGLCYFCRSRIEPTGSDCDVQTARVEVITAQLPLPFVSRKVPVPGAVESNA